MANDHGLYAAFKAKDSRFDGRFFVGVSSTGVYCRPVCRAKMPKAENCTFYPTAAEAERAGYRPCLLCRPELSPGASAADATVTLARRTAKFLEENCANGQTLEQVAVRFGCTARHLRRAFAAEYHVSPVQYLQTCRLLLAKNLLTDTDLPVLAVAMAAGFGSLRRFNDLFRKQYRLSPTALRRETAEGGKSGSGITVALGYRPPYPWRQMLGFLAARAITGVELVQNDEYARTVRLPDGERGDRFGWIRVRNEARKNVLSVTVSSSLLPVLPQVLFRVRHLFDLHCDPHAVYEVLAAMNDIRPGLCVLGTRLPGCFDPFEMSVRAVLGQQITVKAASTLAARVAGSYGTPLPTGVEELTHVFPAPAAIVALRGPIGDHLGPLGVIGTRAKTILALAEAFVQETVDFGLSAQPEVEMEKLRNLPGIGQWTAQYIAMRAMGWPDAFLATDIGVKRALAASQPKELLAMADAWRPWRSYATVNLWNSL